MIRPILSIFFICLIFSHSVLAGQPITEYLLKPTGKYGVSFKNLHWIDDIMCPDPNFSKEHQKDFDANNEKFCHELMVIIYYPTPLNTDSGTPYYRPIVNAEQTVLRTKSVVKSEDIEAISQLKSHTIENAAIVKNSRFPVVLFNSGLGGSTPMYENTITQIVSHGYIVVGINSLLINGDIALPDNRVVSFVDPESWDVVTKKTIPTMEKDIEFVYKKIHDETQDSLFKSMDLKHVGGLGHSFGGRAIANVASTHKGWFKALATLDMEVHMGSFEPKNYMAPSMHIINSYWKSAFSWQNLRYPLSKNGYLVTLSPSKNDTHYSYHMNFTDFSTLQYMPAYQASMAYDNAKLAAGEDVIIKFIDTGSDKLTNVSRPVYLIVKNKNDWGISYYEPGKEAVPFNFQNIPGLKSALENLPKTQPQESELTPVKKMIHAYHQRFGNNLGNGDGFKITESLNLYLLDFYNTFLKNEKNPFKDCAPLSKNTYLECGPGMF
jgi:hypothetical protein